MNLADHKCEQCGASLENRDGHARLCFDCYDDRQRAYNRKAAKERPLRGKAAQAVQRAVHRGDIPRLDGTVRCVDCGKPAKNYDHRDYTKPLDVQPVCIACNKSRGPAYPYNQPAQQ